MKILIILFFIISTIAVARSYSESKSKMGSFASSHTKSSSKSSDDDDDDDDDDNKSSSSGSYSSSGSSSGSGIDLSKAFSLVWYWENMFIKNNPTSIRRQNKLFYIGTSYNYQKWTPTGINKARTNTTELNIAKFELSLFFDSIYLSYETSFLGSNLSKQRELLEIRTNEKHGWERFLTDVVLPFSIMLGDKPFAKIYFGYDEQVFVSTITSLNDKFYSPRKKNPNGELTEIKAGDKITTSTLFKNWHMGFRMDSWTNMNVDTGLFYLTYNKPYSLTIDGEQFSEEIHDTDFSALGFYMDFIFRFNLFYAEMGFKLGKGEVNFVALETRVEDLVGEDLSTMYFQFNTGLGLQYDILDMIKLKAIIRTEYRNFYLSRDDSDEDDDVDDSETFNLNNDFIFTAYIGASVSF